MMVHNDKKLSSQIQILYSSIHYIDEKKNHLTWDYCLLVETDMAWW